MPRPARGLPLLAVHFIHIFKRAASRNMAKNRILIVEDQAIVAEALEQNLRTQGYEVSVAQSAETALKEAAETTPDLVLMDIVLPGPVDGIAAAEQLVTRDIPVIYMTAHAEHQLFNRAKNTEPLAFLAKPLRTGELERAVQLALSNRQRELERERTRQRQAEELRQSEERLRSVLEGVRDYSICTLDASGNVSSWNRGAERMMGYTRGEVLGKHFGLFFLPEDRAKGVPGDELVQARNSESTDDSRWMVRKSGEQYWADGTLTAIRNQDGTVTGFTKIFRDTTESRKMQEALREREERLRVALRAARTGTWRWDLRTNVDIFDENLQQLFGLPPHETLRSIDEFFAIVHPEERSQVKDAFERTLNEGVHLDTEFRVVWPDGSEHWLIDKGEVARDGENKPMYFTGACVDVTERKEAARALDESERRFRLYSSSIQDYALMQLDAEGRIVNWSTGAERVLGYTEAEAHGQPSSLLFTPEDKARGEAEKELAEARENGRAIDERWHVRKDGRRFWASGVLSIMLDEKGRFQGFAKVMRDETERRRADERLRSSLAEKEVLLQEIHHRVKNNLQVISSLLRLQSEHAADEKTLALFDEARNRVRAIGSIHELLYGSPDLASVDFDAYLTRLMQDLLAFYHIGENRLHFETEVKNARLEIGQAIPCGLLVNELVTNAFKHAFPGKRSGRILVTLTCTEQHCRLMVEDNGVGLPEGFDWRNSNSLGLQLVQVLARQLDGEVRAERLTPGTRFEILFPLATS